MAALPKWDSGLMERYVSPVATKAPVPGCVELRGLSTLRRASHRLHQRVGTRRGDWVTSPVCYRRHGYPNRDISPAFSVHGDFGWVGTTLNHGPNPNRARSSRLVPR